MSTKPILFNTDIVRAILDGCKTVTRRAVKGYALEHLGLDTDDSIIGVYDQCEGRVFPVMDYAPYRLGDIMYVREKWRIVDYLDELSLKFEYEADGKISDFIDFTNDRLRKFLKYISRKGWCRSIFMPREAARIFLRVTDVRAERLQDITDEDLVRDFDFCPEAIKAVGRDALAKPFWNSTIEPTDRAIYGWDANPWVWVIEFGRVSREDVMPHG